MNKLVFKFTAKNVDEIEQSRQLPIENCMSDSSVNMLALFLQKGLVDENDKIGVTRAVALSKIDEYLKEKDKTDLMLDITEALVDAGFLSRELNVNAVRKAKQEQAKLIEEKLEEL